MAEKVFRMEGGRGWTPLRIYPIDAGGAAIPGASKFSSVEEFRGHFPTDPLVSLTTPGCDEWVILSGGEPSARLYFRMGHLTGSFRPAGDRPTDEMVLHVLANPTLGYR